MRAGATAEPSPLRGNSLGTGGYLEKNRPWWAVVAAGTHPITYPNADPGHKEPFGPNSPQGCHGRIGRVGAGKCGNLEHG